MLNKENKKHFSSFLKGSGLQYQYYYIRQRGNGKRENLIKSWGYIRWFNYPIFLQEKAKRFPPQCIKQTTDTYSVTVTGSCKCSRLIVVRCAIWQHLYNFKKEFLKNRIYKFLLLFKVLQSDTIKHELRVRSCELRVTSYELKA